MCACARAVLSDALPGVGWSLLSRVASTRVIFIGPFLFSLQINIMGWTPGPIRPLEQGEVLYQLQFLNYVSCIAIPSIYMSMDEIPAIVDIVSVPHGQCLDAALWAPIESCFDPLFTRYHLNSFHLDRSRFYTLGKHGTFDL